MTTTCESRRILVLDDEPDIRALLVRETQRMGLTPVACATAAQAMGQTGSFDVALLDILLPEMSGVQVAHELRSRAATAALPIIFVTIVDSPDDIADMDPAPMVVNKPFDRAELRRTITSALATAA